MRQRGLERDKEEKERDLVHSLVHSPKRLQQLRLSQDEAGSLWFSLGLLHDCQEPESWNH